MPEKNSGQVRMTAVPILPDIVEGKPPEVATHQPATRLANNRK